MSDAEVLSIVSEIVDALPGLRNKNVLIRLNHTALLRAVLLHCGIKDRHSDVFALISNAKVRLFFAAPQRVSLIAV